MQAQGYAARYAEAQVKVVDREQLLLLVFEGGTKFLRLAREALAAGDSVRFAEHLARAQAIISELLGTLDHQAGGAIATNLARLYEFMLFHLTEANASRSVRHIDDVIQVFGIVATSFREILQKRAAVATAAPVATAV
jgi:flagellar protein FliS